MGILSFILNIEKVRKRLTVKDFKENEEEIRQQLMGEEMAWDDFMEWLDREIARKTLGYFCEEDF